MKINLKVKELKDQRKLLTGDIRKILDKVQAEKRDFNETESTEYSRLETEYDTLGTHIEREERAWQREQESADAGSDAEYGVNGEERSNGGEARGGAAGGSLNGFSSFGEMLQAVALSDSTRGERTDARLKAAKQEQRAPTGMNETIPTEGGFLVSQEIVGGLIERSFGEGTLASRVDSLPIGPGKNGVKFFRLNDDSRADGSRYGGIRAYWTGEGQDKQASKPSYDEMSMKLKKLAALCYVTDELLEDTVALEAWIKATFPKEFAFRIDDSILYGTGSGQPLGIYNSDATVVIAKEVSQAAKTITFNNVLAMFSRFQPTSPGGGAWFINRNVMPQLATMAMAVGTGGVPVWMPANGAAGQMFSTLFGLPVIPIEHASTLGTVGDILLADMKEYLMITKGGIQTASSMHVRFIQDETVFRFVYRVDGQPKPDKVITPYKGESGETVSPFVVLATRA